MNSFWKKLFEFLAGCLTEQRMQGDHDFAATTVQYIEGTGYSREAEEDGQRRRVVAFMREQLGEKYQLGIEVQPGQEDAADIWDCSEEVEAAYRVAGLTIPDGACYQFDFCRPVPAPKPADMFFLWNDGKGRIGHVGVFTGAGTVVHAVGGRGVVEDPVAMWEHHKRFRGWRRHPDFARSPEERGNHV